MRLAVTGRHGQVARSLLERAPADIDIVPLARPEVDLQQPRAVAEAMAAARPDAVVNAAAYTAVDLAETEAELAHRINEAGAGAVAAAAARLGIPVVHLSTDYVFDGSLSRPYREDDETGPLGVYGASKLAGERAVAAGNPDHAILRTAWVYSPFGKNFVRTMLTLAETRDELSIVCDQRGAPSYALDIADGIFTVVRNLLARPDDAALRGVFHMTGRGDTDWAGFAEAIFACSADAGGPAARVKRIATSDYPTAARRPANSRLDTARLAARHGVRLPDWRDSLPSCVDRLLAARRVHH
ncbi:dTDP-4-dehydrorhamnose reductase [Rhodopseudomonas palustris HaA2]|uniref:dTDP-4-dehydrorhamnose reductase n=1 Tax=Rhodopseudomonas palustris (strain HaA2) TaxID=316058 RepID=Q2IZT6_RHOP2|nr:dTDP-4-dehydrorhamnose reductase [Rhodopseudomonas palustris]ABD06274.1 dTDP-4-dehydrorhamnose reductase [Rhodopseudomonas palustris HaA2]